MTSYLQPKAEDIELANVLAALGDPIRLAIIKNILTAPDGMNCSNAALIGFNVPKSTLSGHFRQLREAGVISVSKDGVENINRVRTIDLEKRFPGLLNVVLKNAGMG